MRAWAAPPHSDEARETGAEYPDRRGLGHFCREFSDDDLAVAELEIGHQDLVCARVEGATATTRIRTP
jgi:hypothetical protein